MNAIPLPITRARHTANLRRSFLLCTIDGVAAMPIVQMSLPAKRVSGRLVHQDLGFPAAGIFYRAPKR